MHRPHLMLYVADFDVCHALSRLLLNRWDSYRMMLEGHPILRQIEYLGIINLEPLPEPLYRLGAVSVTLTDFGHKCSLGDYAAELYIPIEE